MVIIQYGLQFFLEIFSRFFFEFFSRFLGFGFDWYLQRFAAKLSDLHGVVVVVGWLDGWMDGWMDCWLVGWCGFVCALACTYDLCLLVC